MRSAYQRFRRYRPWLALAGVIACFLSAVAPTTFIEHTLVWFAAAMLLPIVVDEALTEKLEC